MSLRTIVLPAALLACAAALSAAEKPATEKPADTESAKASPVLKHTMKSLDGDKRDLADYRGKVLLIVNVASECGATPQYAPLERLYQEHKDDGLVVLGFPCNQFGGQEPGTAAQISAFCTEKYHVTFPMFAKIDVNGPKAAPLFKYLTSEQAVPDDAGKVQWNFEKFLIGRDGKVVARFRTSTQPDDPAVVAAIEQELAKQ